MTIAPWRVIAARPTLTRQAFVELLPRGDCGHYICSQRDRCALQPQENK